MKRFAHMPFLGLLAVVMLTTGTLAFGQTFAFVDVTGPSGLTYVQDTGPFVAGSGVAVGDIDGDGWEDVLFCGSTLAGIQVFQNNGNKTFTDVTAAVLPNPPNNASAGSVSKAFAPKSADAISGMWHPLQLCSALGG